MEALKEVSSVIELLVLIFYGLSILGVVLSISAIVFIGISFYKHLKKEEVHLGVDSIHPNDPELEFLRNEAKKARRENE